MQYTDNLRYRAARKSAVKSRKVSSNLNASDSGLHHTVSLMYEGGRHIGFGTTFGNKKAARRFQT
ncbi:hypothetical protein DPMN_041941 [Dreissena polymorpha]|uniref:Uncharacterized protein n=1 Tax=Dreissena polymorpha TaxID=45954 RepID=A0A9D4HWL7_DREPO|nr:hypothetical protein DPMN_041941 [Dreissena polymorpha]